MWIPWTLPEEDCERYLKLCRKAYNDAQEAVEAFKLVNKRVLKNDAAAANNKNETPAAMAKRCASYFDLASAIAKCVKLKKLAALAFAMLFETDLGAVVTRHRTFVVEMESGYFDRDVPEEVKPLVHLIKSMSIQGYLIAPRYGTFISIDLHGDFHGLKLFWGYPVLTWWNVRNQSDSSLLPL